MPRELNRTKPENAKNPTTFPDPKPARFPMVHRTRFAPQWNPEAFGPVLGLIELGFWLNDYFGKNINMVELGSKGGESAMIFNAFPFVDVISCVDIWTWHPPKRAFEARLKPEIASREVIHHQLDSVAASTEPHYSQVCPFGDPDFVYVDADHSFESVLNDLDAWYPKLASGGLIGGHDYSNFWGEAKAAVDEFAVAKDLTINTFPDNSFVLTPA